MVGDVVRLTVVPDEGEAEILCRMLRAEGIRCAHYRTNESSGGSDASASFGGWREIVVLEDDLEREELSALEIRRCGIFCLAERHSL